MTEQRADEGCGDGAVLPMFDLGVVNLSESMLADEPRSTAPTRADTPIFDLGGLRSPAAAATPGAPGNGLPRFDLGGTGAVAPSPSVDPDPPRFDLGLATEQEKAEFLREQVLASEQMLAQQVHAAGEAAMTAQLWSLGEAAQIAQDALEHEQLAQHEALAQQADQAHAAFQQSVDEQLQQAQEQEHTQVDGGQSLLHVPAEINSEDVATAVQDYSSAVNFNAGMNASMNAVLHNMGH